MSNPPPVIQWTRPSGDEVVDGVDSRLSIQSGVLAFEETTAEDNGTWICLVMVEGVNVTVPGGEVISSLEIGNASNSVELIVTGLGELKSRLGRSRDDYRHSCNVLSIPMYMLCTPQVRMSHVGFS
jgi:hypothetical protein